MADGGRERERLGAAEFVALTLGDIITELLDDLRAWPRWVSRKRRWIMEGKLTLGVRIYNDWTAAYLTGEET
jgi:hypothetical protein